MATPSSKLQGLLHFWEQTDLPASQSRLDALATSIASSGEESGSKSELIAAMKSFKSDQPDHVRVAAAPMVKLFQREVDAANKRARTAEKAFFDAYKILAEAADPVPILRHAVQSIKGLHKVEELEVEKRELSSQLATLRQEASEARDKERRLQELQTKVDAYDRNIDATLDAKLKEASNKLLDEYNNKLAALEEDKFEAQRQKEEMAKRLLEKSEEVDRLREQCLVYQSSKAALESERSEQQELLMADMERSQRVITEQERELELMRETIQELRTSMAGMESRLDNESKETGKEEELDALRRELKIKERELQHFVNESHRQKEEFEQNQALLKTDLERTKMTLENVEEEIQRLRQQLEQQADYESIKKDLGILQSMEFSSDYQENDDRPLEEKILARSKILQNENTTLRMEKERYTKELQSLGQSLELTKAENDKQKTLITELESHVAKLQSMSPSIARRGEAEGRSSADILLDAWDTEFEGDRSLLNSSPNDNKTSSSNMLTIVQAQRERYRRRNEELEELTTQQGQQMNLLLSECETLKSDNVKLYEKIRFLQVYNNRGSERRQQVIDMDEDATASKYRSQYERGLDPFSSFSSQERMRRVTQLNVLEKMILIMLKFVVANKWARLVAVIYILFMHLLVFLVLMRSAYSDAMQRDLAADWHHKFMERLEDERASTAG